jgi:hypothetical protein
MTKMTTDPFSHFPISFLKTSKFFQTIQGSQTISKKIGD